MQDEAWEVAVAEDAAAEVLEQDPVESVCAPIVAREFVISLEGRAMRKGAPSAEVQ